VHVIEEGIKMKYTYENNGNNGRDNVIWKGTILIYHLETNSCHGEDGDHT
jgi:hypothetical protein